MTRVQGQSMDMLSEWMSGMCRKYFWQLRILEKVKGYRAGIYNPLTLDQSLGQSAVGISGGCASTLGVSAPQLAGNATYMLTRVKAPYDFHP